MLQGLDCVHPAAAYASAAGFTLSFSPDQLVWIASTAGVIC
ncbi:MAG TPA: hypothetical protein P5138_07630 [Solirubrobacterales bacterium]|nr:hypothetical protein [Solirubrobacterales bacterium]